MNPTVTIEIPAGSEAIVRQVLALHEEMNALALSAPDGTVLDACEEAVIPKGRDLIAQVLSDAVARRIEAAEKRGPRSAPASAVAPRRIAASPVGNSSRPSAS
jgi:hypothetical protein